MKHFSEWNINFHQERILPTTLPRILCYEITDVLVDGVSRELFPSYTFTSLFCSHTISVTFNQITYTITASFRSEWKHFTKWCKYSIVGNDQTFTITPNACYAIDDVVVDGVSQEQLLLIHSQILPCFTYDQRDIQLVIASTSSAGSNGSITPLGTSTVLCGNDQSYSITPDPCFVSKML